MSLKLPAVLTLAFDGRTVQLNPDENARYSLNVLHKASGAGVAKRPGSWLRTAQATDFVEKTSTAQICALETINGGPRRGSWAVREVIFAYAEWVSPEFHKAVIDTFSAAVEGKGKKAVKKAQSVARVDGIDKRKAFTSGLAVHGADKTFYADMSDTTNLIILGKSSKSVRKELGLAKTTPIRNHLSDKQLLALAAAESLSAALMANTETRTKSEAREAVYTGAQAVAEALGLTK